MKVIELINWCLEREITFSLDGENIRINGSPAALTPEAISKIKEYKPALIDWLKSNLVEDSPKKIKPRLNKGELIPLSLPQQRLWLICKLYEDSNQYNIPAAIRLQGKLNIDALQKTFDSILQRHEVLRTTYLEVEGEGRQRISDCQTLPIAIIDISDVNSVLQEQEMLQLIQQESAKPFNLEKDLMIRVTLVKLAELSHVLAFTIHHISADGWSTGVLTGEFIRLYSSFEKGFEPKLPPLEIQYGDFSIWQREYLDQSKLQKQIRYWREQLDNIPAVHQLPLDGTRKDEASPTGAVICHRISKDITKKLTQLARKNDSTLFIILHCLFALLLNRYSGQADIVIGTPIAGRSNKQLESLVGFFVNSIVLRSKFEAHQTFNQLLTKDRETVLNAFAHQDIPFDMLLEHLKVARSKLHSPLFQIIFGFQEGKEPDISLAELSVEHVNTSTSAVKYELELQAFGTDEGLILNWIYMDSLFNKTTIQGLADSFDVLIDEVLKRPDASISELNVTTQEQLAIIEEWNDSSVVYEQNVCVHQLIERQCQRTPDAIAVRFEQKYLTYRQLNEKSNCLANYLIEEGVEVGQRVGILQARSIEMLISLLAVMKTGATYVPLDIKLPQDRISYMIDDAGIEHLLLKSQHLSNLSISNVDVTLVDDAFDADWMIEYGPEETIELQATLNSESLIYIIYTSGSTGKPKGVMIPHRGAVNYLDFASREYFSEYHRGAVMSSPLSFDATVTTLFSPLITGKELVILPDDQDALVNGLKHYLFESKDSWLFKLTPAHLSLMENTGLKRNQAEHTIVVGGEQLTVNTLYPFKSNYLPYATFINEYGPTETVVGCSVYTVRNIDDLDKCEHSVLIGRPIQNTGLHILNDGKTAPIGVVGELYISGAGLAHGYIGNSELTEKVFIDHTLENGKKIRLYKTGDRVRLLNDNNLEFLGRIDDQIKLRGFRIELGEIESLLDAYPSVKESVVVLSGEGDERQLIAYISPENPINIDVLKKATSVSIPAYLAKYLPQYIIPSMFAVVESFPLTANGKIDKKTLVALSHVADQTVFEEPETTTQKLLAQLWQSMLNVEKLGKHADFFKIGGHSLLAMRFISVLAKNYGVQITLNTLFEHSVLADLAEFIDENEQETYTAIDIADRSKPLPLSFPQRRLWFIDKLGRGSSQYNIPIAIKLNGVFDKQLFNVVVETIVDRHEILRTTYMESSDGPVQVVQNQINFEVTQIDLTSLTVNSEEQNERLMDLLSKEAAKPFDLKHDFMLRVSLYQLSKDNYVAQFTVHHIAADGWSLGVVVSEFVELYSALRKSQANPLKPLVIQYADFAAWQNKVFVGTKLTSQLDYWLHQLEAIPPVHSLPLDKSRPAKQSFAGEGYEYVLSGHLVKKLNVIAANNGATLFMLLHSAFALLVGRWSNEKDIVIGSPIAGRRHPDLEPLIGFFVNTLALRTKLQESQTFEQLLQHNKQVVLEAFDNQDIPFETLVDSLKLERSLSYSPVFQVMFTMQNNEVVEEQLPGLSIESVPTGQSISKFDLELMITEEDGKLFVSWTFSKSLFDRETIVSFANSFKTLLQQIVVSPAELIFQLPLVDNSHSELSGILTESGKALQVATVHQWFEHQVLDTPEKIALVYNDLPLNFEQLNAHANQLAHALIEKGVEPGNTVGICMERSAEMVISVLAIMKCGAAFLPIDPALPKNRRDYMVSDSGAKLVLVLREQQLARMEATKQKTREQELLLDQSCNHLVVELNSFKGYPTNNPAVNDVDAENTLCYVIYTSGSTGKPKGVLVHHAGLVNYLSHAVENYLNEDISGAVLSTPLSFDASITTLLAPLVGGYPLVVLPESQHECVNQLIKYLGSAESYLFKLTPAHLELLASKKLSGSASHVVVIGGEQLTVSCLLPWKKEFLPNAVFINEYGPTETVVGCCVYQVSDFDDIKTDTNAIPIGQPIHNTQLYILRDGQEMPMGAVGELFIAGKSVSKGYLNQVELTDEKFVSHQSNSASENRLYRTGDLVRLRHDGNLEFISRIDSQLKIRGYRVEAGEIEARLTAHNGVKEAVVVVNGKGNERHLVAYYIANSQSPLESADLKSWLRESLAEYMIPTKFAAVESFILTQNGKVDRRALPPIIEQNPSNSQFVAPKQGIEKQLTEIWNEVLDVSEVGVNDNFFEIGGNSLLSIKVQQQVSQRTPYTIELTDIFEYPTIKRLSEYLTKSSMKNNDRTLDISVNNASDKVCQDIAVIGMAGRFPGAQNIDEFWQNIRAGVESIQFFSDEELLKAGVDTSLLRNPAYVKSGYVLEGLKEFDAKYFSFTPREAEILDPQQRYMLMCASEALEHAGYGDQSRFRSVGVFVGIADSMYMMENILPNPEISRDAGLSAYYSNSSGFISTRISYKLNLTGPSINVLTACSTSLVALHQACNSLMLNECEMALAGGASISQLKPRGYFYEEGGIVSPDGHCRPFDIDAQGTRAGNGAGVLLLKPLDRALADKDTIHAVIKGSAINNDAAEKVGYTAPSIGGQSDVIQKALNNADISPASIQYVEAHGTGTRIGDPIEVKALQKAYATEKRSFCALGTVKANIGHLDTAAGVAGLIKVIQAIKHKEIPPSINFKESNQQIHFEQTPFYINTKLKPWICENEVRRAAISSFGIGGTNAHVVLEEAPDVDTSTTFRTTHLLPVSAKSKSALAAVADNLSQFLQGNKHINLHDVAYTLQVGRTKHEYGYTIACQSIDEAIELLQQKQKIIRSKPNQRSVVFMFPGQGSQHVDMAQQLYLQEPLFKSLFDQCSTLLAPYIETDLKDVIFATEATVQSKERINQTRFTQPALFVVEYCLAKMLQSWGIEPEAMIGHSIGEYVAACLAGVMTLEDALMLVSVRGRLMQQVELGSMLSVALSENELIPFLKDTECCLAGVNSNNNCVASGSSSNIDALVTLLDSKGIIYRLLHTSHAFHSKMMDVILDEFRVEVRKVKFNSPNLLYVSNVTGCYVDAELVTNVEYWVSHLRNAVRFSAGIDTILADNVTLRADKLVLEVGPGISLSTLARKSTHASEHAFVSTLRHVNEDICDVLYLTRSLGRIAAYGIDIDWSRYHQEFTGRRIPLPTYPFENVCYWIEPNLNTRKVIEESSKKLPLDQWLYIPYWKQLPLNKNDKQTKLQDKLSWLLLMDDEGVGESLAQSLQESEQFVIKAYPRLEYAQLSDQEYSFDIRKEDDYLTLINNVRSSTKLSRIVHLTSLQAVDESPYCDDSTHSDFGEYSFRKYDLSKFETEQEVGAYSALATIKAIINSSFAAEISVDFITNDVDSISSEDVTTPGKATIMGLFKVAPQEYPELQCRHIDITLKGLGFRSSHIITSKDCNLDSCQNSQQQEIHSQKSSSQVFRSELGIPVQRLFYELLSTHRASSIALRGNRRWGKHYSGSVINSKMPAAITLLDRGVYVITGGLGNIGLILAEYISKAVDKPKLVLLGRSIFPDEHIWNDLKESETDQVTFTKVEKIRSLRSAGAEVAVFNVDVGDIKQMQSTFTEVERRFGQINGLIHCAGQIHGSMKALIETTPDDFVHQYRSKVDGLLVLERLLETRQFDFCLLMSSLSSVLGGLGFSAYSAANIFMDAFVHMKHHRGDERWLSVNWDGWNFQSFEGSSFNPDTFAMSPEEGMLAFSKVLETAYYPQLIQSTGVLAHRINQWLESQDETERTLYARPELDTDYVKPTNAVEEQLVAIWQDVLGIEQIGIHDSFFDIGGDSLIATRVISAIRKTFLISEAVFSIRDFFEHPVIEKIAEKIAAGKPPSQVEAKKAEFLSDGKVIEEGVF